MTAPRLSSAPSIEPDVYSEPGSCEARCWRSLRQQRTPADRDRRCRRGGQRGGGHVRPTSEAEAALADVGHRSGVVGELDDQECVLFRARKRRRIRLVERVRRHLDPIGNPVEVDRRPRARREQFEVGVEGARCAAASSTNDRIECPNWRTPIGSADSCWNNTDPWVATLVASGFSPQMKSTSTTSSVQTPSRSSRRSNAASTSACVGSAPAGSTVSGTEVLVARGFDQRRSGRRWRGWRDGRAGRHRGLDARFVGIGNGDDRRFVRDRWVRVLTRPAAHHQERSHRGARRPRRSAQSAGATARRPGGRRRWDPESTMPRTAPGTTARVHRATPNGRLTACVT